jgi:chromosome segregation ATPase
MAVAEDRSACEMGVKMDSESLIKSLSILDCELLRIEGGPSDSYQEFNETILAAVEVIRDRDRLAAQESKCPKYEDWKKGFFRMSGLQKGWQESAMAAEEALKATERERDYLGEQAKSGVKKLANILFMLRPTWTFTGEIGTTTDAISRAYVEDIATIDALKAELAEEKRACEINLDALATSEAEHQNATARAFRSVFEMKRRLVNEWWEKIQARRETNRLAAENAELRDKIAAAINKIDSKHTRLEKTLRIIDDLYYGGQLDAYYQVHDWLNEILQPEEPK